jgi:hypothetical protein
MTASSSNLRWPHQGLTALGLAVVCLSAAILPAQVGAEPIIFSKPTDGGFATNLYSLIAPEESRTIKDKLQERQLRAGQVLKPHNALLPELGPLPTRRVFTPSKEQRGKMDNDKNWAFSLQEELDKKDPTMSEALKLMDALSPAKTKSTFKSDDTAEERYVARLTENAQANPKANGQSVMPELGEDALANNRASATSGQRPADSVLRSLLDSGTAQGGLADFMRNNLSKDGNSSGTFASPSAQSARMSDFRALLEGRSPLSALDQAPSQPRSTGFSGLPGAGGSSATASKLGSLGSAGGSSWNRPPVGGLTPMPSLSAPRSAISHAPPAMVPPSPLRIAGPPIPASPTRR